MGERAKIIVNEYTALELLKRDDLNLDKFYSSDLKIFVKVAQQEINKLQQEQISKYQTLKDLQTSNDEWKRKCSKYKSTLDKIKEIMGEDLSNIEKIIKINVLLEEVE